MFDNKPALTQIKRQWLGADPTSRTGGGVSGGLDQDPMTLAGGPISASHGQSGAESRTEDGSWATRSDGKRASEKEDYSIAGTAPGRVMMKNSSPAGRPDPEFWAWTLRKEAAN